MSDEAKNREEALSMLRRQRDGIDARIQALEFLNEVEAWIDKAEKAEEPGASKLVRSIYAQLVRLLCEHQPDKLVSELERMKKEFAAIRTT
ncbi:MAG TPA: hypothetical protein VMU11_01155 [Verrucomicrobiae bacterium]|nr:hypothetical protein [Verrucomicrobiae bacterium]